MLVEAFKVIEAGMLTVLQDLGRKHVSQYGVGQSGALDETSFLWANWLCGNDDNSPCLEILLGGLTLTALCDTHIALTGANAPLLINGKLINNKLISNKAANSWRSHQVKSGDTISIGQSTKGMRLYLACSHGFHAQPSFNSAANNARELLGGHKGNGSKLVSGDTLYYEEISQSQNNSKQNTIAPIEAYPNFEIKKVRFVRGYQGHALPSIDIQRFTSEPYRITQEQDRMGMRMQGAGITMETTPLDSEGICYGAIQIPPDGQPIIMLKDRQTIGGYPKIGSVLPLDCFSLAQSQINAEIHFEEIDVLEAQRLMQLYYAKLNRLKSSLSNAE